MITSLKQKTNALPVEVISIALLWLFQLSGIIGISLGYQDWFIDKTPINLSLVFILLVINFPLFSTRYILSTSLFFVVGMAVEWVGVTYGVLFGSYSYGDSMGFKIAGVPILIGANWAILVLTTGVCANALAQSRKIRVLIGALLMLFLDFFMERSAPIFDFWTFDNYVAPIENYISWFVLALGLHAVFQYVAITGNKRFSLHVVIAQFVFFIYFYAFFSI
jgi:bisanhydrobacterioruberin hydratase